MGGISQAGAGHGSLNDRAVLRLRGRVSLENNGGFVQVALDLSDSSASVDARAFAGVCLELHGDNGCYQLNLRTADCVMPWQSYRAPLQPARGWYGLRIPFGAFSAHRLSAPLDLQRLRRIGLLAIGTAREVDVSLARLSFYREPEE